MIFLSRFVKKGCRLYKTAPLFSTMVSDRKVAYTE
nr:MAG TPA: hypothetical protein [Bacteriophage sp.]